MRINENSDYDNDFLPGYEGYLRRVNEREAQMVKLELTKQEALTLVGLLRCQQFALKVIPECQSVLDKLLGLKR